MTRTFGCGKVQDVPVFPEHINLLNSGNRLHVQLLECALQLFVVLRGRRLRLAHDFAAHGPLTTYISRPHTQHASKIAKNREKIRRERTDPVGRGLRLQLRQFCGVHGADGRGSGTGEFSCRESWA